MKHPMLCAVLAAISSPASPLLAAPQASLSQKTAFQQAASPTLPGSLDPGALAALGNALLIDEPGDGRTWARGPLWKASFGPEGFTYIPFFGSDAPQSYPLEFNLFGASVGGQPIELAPRNRVRHGQTVSLERGALQEVYHLGKDTVEQTFVFDRLGSRGEIVLDVALETELTGVSSPDGGFTFYNELGQVQYGQAVAVDALGNTLRLQQRLTEIGLQIIVPADFVRTAALPLVVDPILTTVPITGNTRRQIDLDVAYEGNNNIYQIVYAELQSALDSDILAVTYNATTNILDPARSIDVSSAYWGMPRNASCYHEAQFLCVSVVGNNVGNRSVWGRTRQADNSLPGSPFQISGVGAEQVDVGGKGNEVLSSYDYMVVWQEVDNINLDFDIVAQAVRGDSTLTQGRITIDGDPGDLDRFPAISKSSGRPGDSNAENTYMIVWEREISSTNRNIRAQVIEYTGSMTGHNQFNAYTFSDSRDPDVSSGSFFRGYNGERHWVVVFERLIGSDHDIFAVVARDGSADNARNINTMQNLNLDRDHRDPVVAFDGFDHYIAYHTEAANGDRSVHFTSANVVHDDGELRMGLTFRRDTLALSEGAVPMVGLASRFDGGGPFNPAPQGDALAVWTSRVQASNLTNVAGAVIEESELYVAGSQYCAAATNSTGHSAWIKCTGAAWNPGTTMELECSQMPPNVFGYFLVSNQTGFVPNPSGSLGNLCLGGAIGRFNQAGQILNSGPNGQVNFGFNNQNMPSPFGPVAAMSGQTWNFQCWFRDNGSESNFSNAVGVTFD